MILFHNFSVPVLVSFIQVIVQTKSFLLITIPVLSRCRTVLQMSKSGRQWEPLGKGELPAKHQDITSLFCVTNVAR
jgi:hypothetical protein